MPPRPPHILDADFLKGGPGSGNFGHAGRPGERGGSAPRGGETGGQSKAPTSTRYQPRKFDRVTHDSLPEVKEHFAKLGFQNIDIASPLNFDPAMRDEVEKRLTNAVNLASEVFSKYRNEGFPIPPKLTMGTPRVPGEIAAFGFPPDLSLAGAHRGTFHIAYTGGFWRDPKGIQAEANHHGDLSSADPAHSINHEFGHFLHYTKAPYRFYTMSFNLKRSDVPPYFNRKHYDKLTTISGNLGASILRNVSRYAISDPGEFVAETFAGMQAGKKYPSGIMKYYKLLGGPFKSDFTGKK